MIERVTSRDHQQARRAGVVPSSSLRPHFVSLARQVRRWAGSRPGPVNVGVTSLVAKAGRSTVSFNLASSLTSIIRDEVLLVEADFGKHFVTRRLGKSRSAGLSELITGFEDAEELIHETPLPNLSVLGSGRVAGQDALELPFDMLGNVVSDSFNGFGYVVFDLPVANHLTACYSIAGQLDGVILCVESNQIDQRQISRFRKQMEGLGVEIIGIVINKS